MMKNGCLTLPVVAFCLVAAGCAYLPASSGHVDELTRLTADMAKNNAEQHRESPEAQRLYGRASHLARETSAIGGQAAAADFFSQFGLLEIALGAFGLGGGGLAALARRSLKKTQKLASEVADLPPKAARKRMKEMQS